MYVSSSSPGGGTSRTSDEVDWSSAPGGGTGAKSAVSDCIVFVVVNMLNIDVLLTAQRRPAEVSRQHGSVPASTFLHAGLFTADVARQPAVPRAHRTRARPADVRRQEHDGSVRPTTRPLPHRRRHVPWTHVHEGGLY